MALGVAQQNGIEITNMYVEEMFDVAIKQTAMQNGANESQVLTNVDKKYICDLVALEVNVYHPEGGILQAKNDNHTPWLDDRRAEIDWSHWNAYKQLMTGRLAERSLHTLNQVTDEVLNLIGDPEKEGIWDRRGLVMGTVQSGKTANYVGLINKAVDAGYKVVIVLAGMHDNLRSQTQFRIDEGFIGRNTRNGVGAKGSFGVGHYKKKGVDSYTAADASGDFNKTVANQVAVAIRGGLPKVFVVKKNKTILKNLREWLQVAAQLGEHQQKIPGIPLLVIDDEADQASINTKKENPSHVDLDNLNPKEYEPSAINAGIRRILNDFEQSSYVGYTATPFANIFQIMLDEPDNEFGDDLFPRSFIKTLAPPSNYVGPAELFGLVTKEGEDEKPGLPLTENITDLVDWIPDKHKKTHRPNIHFFPESLHEAICSFVLACAARLVREPTAEHHNSMLVHVTRFVAVQEEVTQQIRVKLDELRDGLLNQHPDENDTMQSLRNLWQDKFVPKITKMINDGHITIDDEWINFPEAKVQEAVGRISVKQMSGSSKDSLDYEIYNQTGRSFIAVGGDKLSRGLTLEGLTVSYYSRASKMYDTLMQMGRWFGYRHNYLDLCRLWTTSDIRVWYRHIATAAEELTQDFNEMVTQGRTPEDFGLRVRSHPDLMVTNRMKWRHGEKCLVTFSGFRPETVSFDKSLEERSFNLETLDSLIKQVTQEPNSNVSESSSGDIIISGISHHAICAYLDRLSDAESYRQTRYPLSTLRDYIERRTEDGGLVDWTVLLRSNSQATKSNMREVGKFHIGISHRTNNSYPEDSTYTIGSLISAEDEKVGLTAEEVQMAEKIAIERRKSKSDADSPKPKPYGSDFRMARRPESALLILYLLRDQEQYDEEKAQSIDDDPPYVGLCLSFPDDRIPGGQAIEYIVNPVWLNENR